MRDRSNLRIILCLLLGSPTLLGQEQQTPVAERLIELERQNREIVKRLEASERRLEHSEQRNRQLEAEVETLTVKTETLEESEQDSLLEEQINSISARWNDGWSNATRSGNLIQFYGYLRTDAYYNDSKTVLDPILTLWVLPEGDGANDDDDAFAMETRLVRFGIDLDMGEIGSAKVTGKLETDFANFILARESRQTPRIRLAYINLEFGSITLRIGQDWDVISPLYPHAHNELLLWGAGNLGDRRPQVQFIWAPPSAGPVDFVLEASLGASGTVDGLDNDGSPNNFGELDGYDAGHPHGQLRLGLNFDTHVDARGSVGVWGYLAGIETDTEFAGEDHFTPYTVGIDLNIPIASFLTLRAEAWYGQALTDVRGNIIQSINPDTGDEISGYGGWAELRFQVTENFLTVLGASLDDPDNSDIPDGGRTRNFTAYLGLKYDWGGGLVNGLDLMYWETDWQARKDGDLIRVGSYVQLSF